MTTTIPPAPTMQQTWKGIHRAQRISKTLEDYGITMKLEDRWTLRNVRMVYRGRGAEIGDGTIQHNYRYEVSGRTYPVKEILKQHGFRWDPKLKVWWAPASHNNLRTIGSDLIRSLKGSN
jgi:hypothetical protein